MSKRSGNLQQKIETNIMSEVLRKARLKDEFIKKSKALTETNKPVEKSSFEVKPKEIIKKNDSELTALKKKNKEQSKVIIENKKTIIKLKKRLYLESEDKKVLKNELSEKELLLTAKDNIIKDLNTKLKLRENTIGQLKSNIARVRSSNGALNELVDNQRVHLRAHTKTFLEKNTEIKNLQNQLNYASKESYEIALKELEKARQRQLKERDAEIERLQVVIKKLKKQKAEQEIQEFSEEEIGFLDSDDFKKYFISTQGKRSELYDYPDGTICKVEYMGDNKVRIIKAYEDEGSSIEVHRDSSNHKVKVIKKAKERLVFSVRHKVLVIGSQRKELYLKELEKSNLDVSWFDSYENSQPSLERVLDSFDIVICCKDHSRHYATELMIHKQEENTFKYNVISKDTVQRIIVRINYVVENLKKGY